MGICSFLFWWFYLNLHYHPYEYFGTFGRGIRDTVKILPCFSLQNLGTPFLFSKDFWHSLYPLHFSYCLWPSPQTPSLLHRRLRKVQMARILSRKIQVGIRRIRRKEFGLSVTWKMDETYWNMMFSVQSQNLQKIHRNIMNMMGFGKGVQMEARKETQSNLRGPYETHKNTRCFVAIPVPHCIPSWIFMRFKIV